MEGPGTVFNRYHKKDIAKSRVVKYGEDAKTCTVILGVDANAQYYLWCMTQKLPLGYLLLRKSEDIFAPHSSGNESNVT